MIATLRALFVGVPLLASRELLAQVAAPATPASTPASRPAEPVNGPAVPVRAPTAPIDAPADNGSAPDFAVSNIRIEGLQRISEGTVYNYLPINIGDRLTAQRSREA